MSTVASEQEVLETLTAFLRGGFAGAGERERLRAAELLGKRYGLFGGETESGEGAVVIEGGGELK